MGTTSFTEMEKYGDEGNIFSAHGMLIREREREEYGILIDC